MASRWSDRLSLRSKATSAVLLVTLLALFTVAIIGLVQMRRLVTTQEHETVATVAQGIGHAAELALAVRDEQELARLAERFLHNDQIFLIAIYDDAGKLVINRVRTPELWEKYISGTLGGSLLLCEQPVTLGSATNEFSTVTDPNAIPPAAVSARPHGATMGRVVVGLSTGPALLAQHRQTQLTVVSTMLAAAVSSIVVFWLLGKWTRRLNHLVVVTERISQGDFGAPIDDDRHDEIGRLSGAYENMRRAVQQRDSDLRQFNNTLQDQVRERTRSLEDALQAARAADKAKSRFLATMSHEIRTPLNGVVGTVDLLRQTSLDENQRRYVQVAKSSADALLAVINDILDFSKIEAGRMELEAVAFDLLDTVEDVVRMAALTATRKGLELSCIVEPELPARVVGDPGRLRQILSNLLNNALKFTENGQVVMRAALVEQTDKNLMIRFSVTDTGIGIPAERIDRLFQSFSQVDASTTRKYGGSGLGLAICKRLVELMGGSIGVTSEIGRGSTFHFTARMTVGVSITDKPRLLGHDMSKARVIAVDDNAINCEILQQQLAVWKLSGAIAHDGAQALRMMHEAAQRGEPFDVAILDWHMPGMDGVELARAIRGSTDLTDVSLIMLTSIEDQVHAAELVKMGFSGYLIKPVCQSQLFDAVASAYRGAGRGPAEPFEPSFPDPQAVPAAEPSGIHVLLAEDNEINQMVAAEILAKGGFTCDIVDNGIRAVKSAITGRYDVVLMDCQMPEMDGFEAARAIRKWEADNGVPPNARLPLVALTANAIQGDRDLCLQAGMDDYVSKPIDHAELCRAIRTSVAASSRRRFTDQIPAPAAESQAAAVQRPADPPFSAHATVPIPSSGILARFLQSPNAPDASLVAEPATSPASGAAPLNMAELCGRCMNNVEFVHKILTKFQERVVVDLSGLARTIAERKLDEAARLAHALKGSASNLSASAVRGAAADIESLSRQGDAEQAEQALARLRAAVDDCLAYIPQALGNLPPAPPARVRP